MLLINIEKEEENVTSQAESEDTAIKDIKALSVIENQTMDEIKAKEKSTDKRGKENESNKNS